MSIREILRNDVSNQKKKAVLESGGQVVDILTDLPTGYEYRVKKLTPGALNSEWVLLIVQSEGE